MGAWSSEWLEQLMISVFKHCSICLSSAEAVHSPLSHLLSGAGAAQTLPSALGLWSPPMIPWVGTLPLP